MSTRITVVTPSYNQADFLERTLRSVLLQRDHVHEFFVLDGGSTDGSVDIIRRYADEIDWWVSEDDKGQADAIYRGFERATGDVLCWINSDDLLLPGTLARVQKIFDANPSVDLVTGYLALIDGRDRIIALPRVPGANTFLGRRGMIQVSQQATFFRRSIYEKVGGLDISLHCAMDLDLWARFYKARAVWGKVSDHLAAFRKHGEAKGSGNSWWKRYQDEKSIVWARYPEFFGNEIQTRGMLFIYRALQLLSGRQIRARWETSRARGKQVAEVFANDRSN